MKLTPGALPGVAFLDLDSIVNCWKKWSGREDLNLRPPGPELSQSKLQVLYLVSLRGQQASFSLAQLYRSCTEKSGHHLDSPTAGPSRSATDWENPGSPTGRRAAVVVYGSVSI